MSTVFTDSNDTLIFPPTLPQNGLYQSQRFAPDSPHIVFHQEGLGAKVIAERGMETRLWYGRDLRDFDENSNVGRSCVDAYAVIPGEGVFMNNTCNFDIPSLGYM